MLRGKASRGNLRLKDGLRDMGCGGTGRDQGTWDGRDEVVGVERRQ